MEYWVANQAVQLPWSCHAVWSSYREANMEGSGEMPGLLPTPPVPPTPPALASVWNHMRAPELELPSTAPPKLLTHSWNPWISRCFVVTIAIGTCPFLHRTTESDYCPGISSTHENPQLCSFLPLVNSNVPWFRHINAVRKITTPQTWFPRIGKWD